jgi:hypothetical protein
MGRARLIFIRRLPQRRFGDQRRRTRSHTPRLFRLSAGTGLVLQERALFCRNELCFAGTSSVF